jgi:HlyD family secretion protein
MFDMKRLRPLLILLVLAGLGYAAYRYLGRPPSELVLTGIVTTNDVVVSPQIGGQIRELKAVEGDTVKANQLLALITPDELRADTAYYTHSAEGLSSQVQESEATLRWQERQTGDQIKQAEATLAATEAQQMAAVADLENAKLVFDRTRDLAQKGVDPPQALDQARTTFDAAGARLDSLRKQVDAQRSNLALAHANAEQVAVRKSQVRSTQQQQQAANAQRAKAEVRLGYTEVRAPIDGIVDVRAVRVGEVVTPGQPIVTLINPDDLWVRADVEETYIDRVRIGDKMTIRLPSGDTREGTVFYRGVDAGFATQRDVSRTKRDIKTFEVRLRADNKDRRLALGMTAYVLLPLGNN